jgi:hypothetical protein
MALTQLERILILAKTYPSPSAQYIETSCVAGINDHGAIRRLYPVPFRMIEENSQFKKWQWIEVRTEKARKDHRPESHKLYVDTISCGESITTKKEWSERRVWLEKIPSFDNFDAVEASRVHGEMSIALLRPKQSLSLIITKARNSEWTDEEKKKLLRQQMQFDIFSEVQAKNQIQGLRKVPFDFYYRYVCDSPVGEKEYYHKIVDWEAGALFWNCQKTHGADWEKPFRAKLEGELIKKDLMFLMGNMQRFPDQWLIISLVYPPKRNPAEMIQGSLFQRY